MTYPTPVGRGRPAARRALLALSTIICSGLATPAWAQTAIATQVDTVDENGVDLSTLIFSPQNGGEDIGVGSGEFPSRLGLSRSSISSNGTFGVINGSNLSVVITAGTSLQNENNLIYVTIGRIRREFRAGQNFGVPGAKFLPIDGGGGYVSKSLDSGTTVYTYVSSKGDELRFVVSSATVCGRYANINNMQSINCARVSKWTGVNNIIADFSYNVRSFAETDLASVTNTLGLSLKFTYTRYKDSGKYTDPTFGVTSILASSDQLGPCTAQPGCSRTANYKYAVTPPITNNVLDRTNIVLTDFINPMRENTQYVYTGLTTQHYPVLKSVRLPSHPTVDAVTLIRPTSAGTPLKLVDSLGNSWSYLRTINSTNNHVTTTRTDPLGKTRTYEFDARGNLIRFQNELLQVTQWEYDDRGRTTKTTLPNGIVTVPTYDARGNVLSTTTKASPPGSAPDIVTSAQFSADCDNSKTCNQPLSVTDALGNVTRYIYDPTHGGVLTITQPPATSGGVSPQTRFTYGVASGAYVLTGTSTCLTTASCAGTADEAKIVLEYGANGLLPTVKTAQAGDGSVRSPISFTYDALGNLVSEDGPLPGSADALHRRYDQVGRVVGEIKPDPDGGGPLRRAATRMTYDAGGNVINAEIGVVDGVTDADWAAFEPRQVLTSSYDIADRKTADVVTAGGTTYATTQYSYDAASRLDCRAIRMNSATWASLPPSACTPQTAGTAGPDRITKYSYDDADRVTKVTSAYGTAAQADEVTTTYTDTGQMATATDANGNVTTYGYDGFDRLLTTTYPGGSYERLGYDAAGNVTSRRLRDEQMLGYRYDALNRRIFDDNPNTNLAETDVTYAYDLLGRLKSASDGNGWHNSFDYDALGRVTRQYSNLASNTLGYDEAGRMTRQTWGDGFHVTYEYDQTGAMTRIRENGGFELARFDYNDLGRRTKLTRGNGTVTTYSYDPASQLTGLVQDLAGTTQDLSIGLGHDALGRISSRTVSNGAYSWKGHADTDRVYAVNGLNQYTQVGAVAPTYDARGNTTSAGGQSYAYNTRNQLFQNGAGQLFYRNPMGLLAQAPGIGNFDYVSGRLATEQTDTVQRRYVYGPGTDEPLVWYEGAGLGDRRWLHADERGSVVAITDGSGQATAINTYDEYGRPGAGNQGRFQYTGQKWIAELGLYDYKARMYSPQLGRFMQTDPIGYGDGMNLYAYVGSDPVNATDSSGLAGCPPPSPGEVVVCGERLKKPSSGPVNGPSLGGSVFQDFGGRGALRALLRNAPINQRRGTVAEPQNPTLPCSAANQAGKGLRVTLGFTNTPVPGTSHAFVVVTDLATGSRFASRAGPWSGPGGGSAPYITAVSGAYGSGFPDYGATTGSLGVGNLNVSFDQAAQYMNAFAQTTNNNHLAYLGVVQNSNSYAAALLKGMGFTPPSTGRATPGYNSNPVDPSMACH